MREHSDQMQLAHGDVPLHPAQQMLDRMQREEEAYDGFDPNAPIPRFFRRWKTLWEKLLGSEH